MSRLRPYLFIFVLLLIAAVVCLGVTVSSLQDQNQRLEGNQAALLGEIEFYKIDSTRTAASVMQLRLTAEELANSNSSLKADIDELNIKLKRVNSASSTAIRSDYEVKTNIRDSIRYETRVVIQDSIRIIDSIRYVSQIIDYNTPYITLNGLIENDSTFVGHISTRDTIVRVEHRVPKKFLFFRCGTKLVREEYYSKNPHTVIEDVETVVIVDKKGKRKDR